MNFDASNAEAYGLPLKFKLFAAIGFVIVPLNGFPIKV
jgi:hypothetical protein